MGSILGVEKVAAKRTGVSLQRYRELSASGMKWCTGCKSWHRRSEFRDDDTRGDKLASCCTEYRKNKSKGVGRGNRQRDQLKERARGCINARVQRGSLANPNNIPCLDCGHIGPTRRHEYDHFLGYTGPAKTQVEAVCSKCHRKREAKRNGR